MQYGVFTIEPSAVTTGYDLYEGDEFLGNFDSKAEAKAEADRIWDEY